MYALFIYLQTAFDLMKWDQLMLILKKLGVDWIKKAYQLPILERECKSEN